MLVDTVNTNGSEGRQKYPGINGLRALSISLVIFQHLSSKNNIFDSFSGIKWLSPFIEFLQDGQLGVNVFFVISGFLITSLMLEEEKFTKKISIKNFYIRRVLRIFPAYYFLLFIYFILQMAGYLQISGESWLTAVTYTKYFNWGLDWYTAHAWSLSIEEHFYILWPFIFISSVKFRKAAVIFLIFMVPVLRLYLNYYPVSWMNELTIFLRIDAIAMGCFFALYKDEIIKRIAPYWKPLFFGSIIIVFFLRYFQTIATPLHLRHIFIALGLTHGSLANLLIAVIMMYSVFGPKGIWHRALNLKILDKIGVLSYSLYLWQQIFISGSSNWINQFPQNLFVVFLVAICSYNLIEKPFLTLKTKFQSAPALAADGNKVSYSGS